MIPSRANRRPDSSHCSADVAVAPREDVNKHVRLIERMAMLLRWFLMHVDIIQLQDLFLSFESEGLELFFIFTVEDFWKLCWKLANKKRKLKLERIKHCQSVFIEVKQYHTVECVEIILSVWVGVWPVVFSPTALGWLLEKKEPSYCFKLSWSPSYSFAMDLYAVTLRKSATVLNKIQSYTTHRAAHTSGSCREAAWTSGWKVCTYYKVPMLRGESPLTAAFTSALRRQSRMCLCGLVMYGHKYFDYIVKYWTFSLIIDSSLLFRLNHRLVSDTVCSPLIDW